MSERTFIFAAAYHDVASAEGDYEIIKILHDADDIGPYDAAVLDNRGGDAVEVRGTGSGIKARFDQLVSDVPKVEAGSIAALVAENRAALIAIGVEEDAGKIEQAAMEARGSSVQYLER